MQTPIKLQKLLETDNIAEILDDEDLGEIGETVVKDYDTDETSREEWKTRALEAMDVAMQVSGEKNFPWPGAANVRWPGLTIAALQFNARAYPALIPGTDVARCRVLGPDPDGQEYQRSLRISRHMSYQVLEKDENWEDEMDRLLIMLPIVGTLFKKTYFDPLKGSCVSEMVTAFDLVAPYYAKSLEDASRLTHCLDMLPNKVEERIRKEIYREVELPPPGVDFAQIEQHLKENRGLVPPADKKDAPRKILEQHRWLDLDDDGYEEPYIVTVDKSSKLVLRIVKRFNQDAVETDKDEQIQMIARAAIERIQAEEMPPEVAEVFMAEVEEEIESLRKKAEVIRIEPFQYFTKFGFIPAPDGSFYDVGFGTIQRPLVEAINTILNQLIDSGTLQNSASGFVSRSARLKKGDMRFRPFEWKQVDVVGGNLRDAIVPLPIQQPSAVLFEALSLLINYSERMFSVSEMMTGQTPGQNTPATTSMAALEQGMKVYSGIFKRLYRSLKKEFKKIYELNKEYLDPVEYFIVVGTGEQAEVFLEDYQKGASIIPAADPNVASEQMRQMKAEFLASRAYAVPGYNIPAVERRLLESYSMEGAESLYPLDEEGQMVIQPPPDAEIELKKVEEERRAGDAQAKQAVAFAELEMKAAKLGAEISKLEADTALAMARAESEVQGISVDQAKLRIEAMTMARDTLVSIIDAARGQQELENDGRQKETGRD